MAVDIAYLKDQMDTNGSLAIEARLAQSDYEEEALENIETAEYWSHQAEIHEMRFAVIEDMLGLYDPDDYL